MDAKYINKNYLEESIKDYDATIVDPIRNVVGNIYYNTVRELNGLTQLITALIPSSSYSTAKYWTVTSASLPNTFKYIRYTTPADTTGYNISSGSANAVYAKVNGDYLEFSSNLPVTETILTQRIFNSNMSRIFWNCKSFNQYIQIPNSVTSIESLFGEYDITTQSFRGGSESFNQNILIPNSVTNAVEAFASCTGLNQNILIPNSVTNMYFTFAGCSNLNQNILIPNSVSSIVSTFKGCSNLNQNILIPNSVTNAVEAFVSCTSLNQNILIPNSVTNIAGTFKGCSNLNQNILIPNSVGFIAATFAGCSNLNQNILIPNSVTSIAGTFNGCSNLNQNILIPNSARQIKSIFNGCISLNQNILIPNSVNTMINAFMGCTSLNQNIYLYTENLSFQGGTLMSGAFKDCTLLADKYIHIRSSIPMDTSNEIYNSLVNNYTGIDWTGRVVNDLEEPTQWPPV